MHHHHFHGSGSSSARRWSGRLALGGGLLLLGALAVAGCRRVPNEGERCDEITDSTCESETGPGILACLDGEFVYLSCSEDLCQPDAERPDRRWAGTCGMGDDHDVCFCESGPGSGGGSFLLTCYDAREGAEQCVHYTFASESDRDSFYESCAGLTRRSRDVHDCPAGATGDGYCVHEAPGRVSETYTYDSTASELMSRCASTEGIWVGP